MIKKLKWSCIKCEWSGDYPDLAHLEAELATGRELTNKDYQCPTCGAVALEVDPVGTLEYQWVNPNTLQITLDARYAEALGVLMCRVDETDLEKFWAGRTLLTFLEELSEDAFRWNEKPYARWHTRRKH